MKIAWNRQSLFAILLFLAAIYFPLFLHLDNLGLYRWDESRNAVHAFEMSQNGDLIIRYFLSEPEVWETKPPLLTWLQAFFMRLLGYNELAVRLPSALAGLATLLLILRFFYKEFKQLSAGIFSGLALVCSSGYISVHITRTGDHDSLLIFFLMLGLIHFYYYLKDGERAPKHLALCVLALIGGVLSKSITGLFFLPGFLIYALFQKQVIAILTSRSFYVGLAGFLLAVGGYYLAREWRQPGYLEVVWGNELFPRYANTAAGHDYNKAPRSFYYLRLLAEDQFRHFLIWIPLCCLLLFWQRDTYLRQFTGLVLACLGTFLLIVSGGTTNTWYVAPALPPLALLFGMGLALVYEILLEKLAIQGLWKKYLFSGVFVLSVFAWPYKSLMETQVYNPKYKDRITQYGQFMAHLRITRPELRQYFLYYGCRNAHTLFYWQVYTKIYGYQISACDTCQPLAQCEKKPSIGTQVVICNPKILEKFQKDYSYQILDRHLGCWLLQVVEKQDEDLSQIE
ncbi:MAG: glycosyltransferase family 39 protein [Bacteroidota bacterium]